MIYQKHSKFSQLNKTVNKVVSSKPSQIHSSMHGCKVGAPYPGADPRREHNWLKELKDLKEQIDLSNVGLEKEIIANTDR